MAVTRRGEEEHETPFYSTSHNHFIFLWLRIIWIALRARDYSLRKSWQ
jgi:hypothetical protein